MSIQIATRLKAGLIKTAIDKITGGSSTLQDDGDSVKITLSPAQITWLQSFIEAQLNSTGKPDIELDAVGVILPVLLKKIWPYALAGTGAIAAVCLIRKGIKSEY
jgi:hypothetical protein